MIVSTLIQAILLSLIAIIVLHIAARWRRGELPTLQFLAWLAFWLTGAVAVLFPDSATDVARRLGVGRGVDLIIYFSLVALFYAIFRIFVRIERVGRDITTLTRLLAIEVRLREEREGASGPKVTQVDSGSTNL